MISNLKATISKINVGIIKIPTLLGMGILLIGLVGGVYLATQNQTLKSKAAVSTQPKNVNVVNISSSSVSIYWQTDESATGFIQAGIGNQSKQTYRDDRDPGSPLAHKLHFVTLTNLQPDTTYSYFISSGAITYPQSPLSFKTTSAAASLNWPPLVGTIISSDATPLDEAIIVLNVTNAQKLATVTKTGGNFILPLSDFKTADLANSLEDKTYTAQLDIISSSQVAQATITLPPKETALSPIRLGSNVDLTQTVSSPSATAQPTGAENKFDVNSDGVINFADLSIVLQNFGPTKSAKNPRADINKDGVIDQKDANLLLPYLK